MPDSCEQFRGRLEGGACRHEHSKAGPKFAYGSEL